MFLKFQYFFGNNSLVKYDKKVINTRSESTKVDVRARLPRIHYVSIGVINPVINIRAVLIWIVDKQII